MPRPRRQVPWLEQRKGGAAWYAFWYDASKRRVERQSLDTEDQDEAGQRFGLWLIEHYRGQSKVAPNAAGIMTAAMAIDDYLEERIEGPKVEGKRTYRGMMRALRAHFGNLPIAEIDETAAKVYCARRMAGDFGRKVGSSGTLRSELSMLMTAFRHAVRRKRLSADSLPDLGELPDAAEPRDLWYTPAQVSDLFEAAKGITAGTRAPEGRLTRAYRFCTSAYYTASRRKAIERLTWFQFDIPNRLVDLHPPGTRRTNKRRPKVPIHQEWLPIVQRAYEERVSEWYLDGPQAAYYLFGEAATAAKLEGYPHVLRHSRAVHLAQRGVSLYAIAGLLGDTIATVEASYLHHCPEHLRASLDQHGVFNALDQQAIRHLSDL